MEETKTEVKPEKKTQQDILNIKLKNLQAKLTRLQSAKFVDAGQKAEAIARCQAGIDEVKNALASSNQKEK